jgi:beta-lactamase class A
MTVAEVLAEAGCTGSVHAVAMDDGAHWGHAEDEAMAPASVIKVPIALATLEAMATGLLDGTARVRLSPQGRTPGPTGLSLLQDDIDVSVRDLVPLMLTISDNVATDALVDLLGVDAVNDHVRRLGLERTRLVSNLRTMLDGMAREAGFPDYAAVERYDPSCGEVPTPDDVRARLARSTALDPRLGSCSTAREMATLLRLVWTDRAAAPEACDTLRRTMSRQLVRNRLESGFPTSVRVAAKSGALMGVVRNEVGVVTLPSGQSYAVAVFTRALPDRSTDDRTVNTAIGRVARLAVDGLRASD